MAKGMKFNVSYRSPSITGTNLFDLDEFGCFARNSRNNDGSRRTLSKEWWVHPAFTFADRWGRIGIRMQDQTTGEIRWDAVYDLQGPRLDSAYKRASVSSPKAYKPDLGALKKVMPDIELPGKELFGSAKADIEKALAKSKVQTPDPDNPGPCPQGTGRNLCPEEKPVGGEHPFFVPDWCPAPGDGKAHHYRLTIRNLSPYHHPAQSEVGEMFFTQYGPTQLHNTYEHELTYRM